MDQSSERPTAYPSARDVIAPPDVVHLTRLTLDAAALSDWSEIRNSETAHAEMCVEKAAKCVAWSRIADGEDDPEAAGAWLAMAWMFRERASAHSLAARVASAEIAALCSDARPRERALLVRRAARGQAVSS